MANSSYYKNLYKQNKKKVDSYDDNLEDLQKILNNLTDDMNDEIRNINEKLEDLKSDLKQSIRHNSRFTARANEITVNKEKTTTADPNLRVAVNEIEDEISRIEGLRTTAINDRERYYQKYKDKKEEERQQILDILF